MWKVGEEESSKRRVWPRRTAASRREDAAQSCEVHAHTQRPRQAAGQGAEHTLRTAPPRQRGENQTARRAERVGRAALGPQVLPGFPHSPAHAASEQGPRGAGAQGHCYSYIHSTAALQAAGLMGSQHTQAFHFLARGMRGGKHLLVLTRVTPPDTEIRKLVSFLGGLPKKAKFDKQCQKHSETTERPVSREESL